MNYRDPGELLEAYKKGTCDEASFKDAMISYIEESDNENIRERAARILCNLPFSEKLYSFAEQITLSDSNERIKFRISAANRSSGSVPLLCGTGNIYLKSGFSPACRQLSYILRV